MKRFAMIAMMAACLLYAVGSASAGTLYQQEGTDADGTPAINASNQGPTGTDSDNWTNWKWQSGGGTWSGVYAGDAGWLTESDSGDMDLDVEADVEMYCTQSISNNKIYFHLGNIYSATAADKTAYVSGSIASNNGQYIGISFDGQGKNEDSFEKDGDGNYTGVILNGMHSNRDTWRTQDENMDLQILLDYGQGWEAPVNYGDGSHGTITDTLWWLIKDGEPGSYHYQWKVTLLPKPDQPDGDYYLDPVVVVAPVL